MTVNNPEENKVTGTPTAQSLIDDKVDAGDWYRAGGNVACSVCHEAYSKHGPVPGYPWLNVLCNGDFVKL